MAVNFARDFARPVASVYLQLADTDSDGVFDLLTYSALSPDGRRLVDVEDYGMDGQPDFIHNLQDSTAQVYYARRWYAVDGEGIGSRPAPTVEIGGQFRPLDDVLTEIGRLSY